MSILSPMLCKKEPDKFLKHVKSSEDIVWSPKLDGVRCLASVNLALGTVKYTSRNLKDFHNFGKFDKCLKNMAVAIMRELYKVIDPPENTVLVFDGEVMSKDDKFSSVMTQVRRIESVDSSIFKFCLFDAYLITSGVVINKTFGDRYSSLYNEHRPSLDYYMKNDVHVVEHSPIYDEHVDIKDLTLIMDSLVKDGHEGVVFKSVSHFYENKKHVSWLKMKPFHTLDLHVVGWKEGEGKYSVATRLAAHNSEIDIFWTNPSESTYNACCILLQQRYTFKELFNFSKLHSADAFKALNSPFVRSMIGAIVVSYKGVNVDVGSGYTDEQRVSLADDLPNIIEVKFQEETKDGSLRFPIFIRVRDDKDETD